MRLWAQGLTIGVIIAAAALTHSQRAQAANMRKVCFFASFPVFGKSSNGFISTLRIILGFTWYEFTPFISHVVLTSVLAGQAAP